jgi:hypothetical protein
VVILQSEWISSTQTINGKRQIQIPSDYTFFGISEKYILNLYNQLFDFVYYSKGAFSLTEMRNLPIAVRNHYVRRLSKIIEERNEQIQRSNRRR